MLKKLQSDTRYQTLAIGISLAVITCVLGLAAFLTDITEPEYKSMKMRHGHEFGINIAANSDNQDTEIVPGETVDFDPYLTNDGNYDVYVFIEITLPDRSFSLSDVSADWQELSTTNNEVVYYYGTSSQLTALPAMEKGDDGTLKAAKTPSLCSGISLDSATTLKQETYTVEAVGYAIQTDGLDAASAPADVWAMVGGTS